MSLTRKALSTMGIDSDKIDQIIEMHTETVNGLKEQLESYKTEVEKLPTMSQELKELTEYKEKYESEKKSFDDFKKNIETQRIKESKDKAYRQLLTNNKIKPNKIDLIMRTINLDNLELDENNNLKGSEEISKSITDDWSDFIETTCVKGTETATPPYQSTQSIDLSKLNMEDYIKARKNK